MVVERVRDLDEALARANDQVLGLTAGIFADDPAEIDRFLDRIEAGVVYVNRDARRDHRRLARLPVVLRLEGLRLDRQGRPRPVLRAAVPARAESDGDLVSEGFAFGGMFDPDELQKAMANFAEQAQRGQQVAFADNAIALAVQMTTWPAAASPRAARPTSRRSSSGRR